MWYFLTSIFIGEPIYLRCLARFFSVSLRPDQDRLLCGSVGPPAPGTPLRVSNKNSSDPDRSKKREDCYYIAGMLAEIHQKYFKYVNINYPFLANRIVNEN